MRYLLFIIFILRLVNTLAYNPSLQSKNIMLNGGESLLTYSESYLEIEREYETSIKIIDLTYSSGLVSNLKYDYFLPFSDMQFSTSLSLIKNAKNTNQFDDNLSLPTTKYNNKTFMGNPEFTVMKKLSPEKSETHHYIKVSLKPAFTSKEHQYFDERNSYGLSYIFSHTTKNIIYQGEIFTNYFGKIEGTKVQVGKERREAYTDFGFALYPSFLFGNFTFIPQVGYSSLTDYDTHNQLYSRLTDKGFSYFAGIELRYLYKKYFLSLEFFASSLVFNTISEEVDNSIDNEIESRFIKLSTGMIF